MYDQSSDSLFIGFMGATIAVCTVSDARWIAMINHVPYWIYGPVLIVFVTWVMSNIQEVEDYEVLPSLVL